MILDIFYLTVIVTYIVDVSGFTQSWRGALARFLGGTESQLRPLKPFDCGQCMTWWACIVYLLATHRFTLPGVALSAAASLLSYTISQAMIFMREVILTILNKATGWIQD